jgi:hypothetical protein
MNNSEWLREQQRPVREYNERFQENQLPGGVAKWAVNRGHWDALKEAMTEAVRHGKPILDWKPFVAASPNPSLGNGEAAEQ